MIQGRLNKSLEQSPTVQQYNRHSPKPQHGNLKIIIFLKNHLKDKLLEYTHYKNMRTEVRRAVWWV